MNKTIMSLIAGILILAGIFYFTNNEKENKVFQKEKQETSTQKEVKNTQQREHGKKEKLVQKKKEENNPRGPVIYKNDETNKGRNMELKVPAKWSHLDYSRLGQPKEVALRSEEYLPGDQLYSKDDPRYYQDGKKYLSKNVEEIILSLIKDRRSLKAIEQVLNNPPEDLIGLYKEEYLENIKNSFKDINNLIVVDEKTGRKKINTKNINGGEVSFIDYLYEASRFVCSYDGLCPNPDAEVDPYEGENEGKKPEEQINYSKEEVKNLMETRGYSLDEYRRIRNFFGIGRGAVYNEYANTNIHNEIKDDGYQDKKEFCRDHEFNTFCKKLK